MSAAFIGAGTVSEKSDYLCFLLFGCFYTDIILYFVSVLTTDTLVYQIFLFSTIHTNQKVVFCPETTTQEPDKVPMTFFVILSNKKVSC